MSEPPSWTSKTTFKCCSTRYVARHARYAQARGNADQLRIALTTRAVIDQAKGILMAAYQINADNAFALLVRQSQHENLKVHTVPNASSTTPRAPTGRSARS